MGKTQELKGIVFELRTVISARTLAVTDINKAVTKLADIGYQYNANLFPTLPTTRNWSEAGVKAPETLAEALLWKMGKWKIYQAFVSHFSDEKSQSSGTDVVFFAFAKHLQNSASPIYDQHALRALWAIDVELTVEQSDICKSVLIKKSGSWKSIANGKHTIKAYELYVQRIRNLVSIHDSLSLERLDKLFMPLGQALKEHTDVNTFKGMCGIP
jgi:hypothetical protein